MNKAISVWNNFTVGQIDRDMAGRFDLPVYRKGFAKCRNFYTSVKGCLKNRTGFEYIATIQPSVLKEFRFNKDQTYLMLLQENKAQFYTYDSAGKFGPVNGYTEINDPTEFTSNTSADGIEISDSRQSDNAYLVFNQSGENHSAWATYWIQQKRTSPVYLFQYDLYTTAFESIGTKYFPTKWEIAGSNDGVNWTFLGVQTRSVDNQSSVYSVRMDKNTTPYQYWRLYIYEYNTQKDGYNTQGRVGLLRARFHMTESVEEKTSIKTGISYYDALQMMFCQNADVMYLTSESIKPKTITRTSADSFTVADATTTGIDYETFGNPRACAFYGGRLWLGGFSKKPVTVCASETANYQNFTIPESDIDDDDPLQLTLSEISDPIVWLYGGKNTLNAGNAEGISTINGSGGSISSTNVNADLADKCGTRAVYPELKDGLLFYASLDGRRLYAYSYDLLTESFISKDTTLVALDVTKGIIKRITYKKDDNDLIYILFEDGTLCSYVQNKSENISGFFPIETTGFVNDMETITRPDGKKDLFISVQKDETYVLLRLTDEITLTQPDNRRLVAEELKEACYLDNASRYQDLRTGGISVFPSPTAETTPGFNQEVQTNNLTISQTNLILSGEITVAFPDYRGGYEYQTLDEERTLSLNIGVKLWRPVVCVAKTIDMQLCFGTPAVVEKRPNKPEEHIIYYVCDEQNILYYDGQRFVECSYPIAVLRDLSADGTSGVVDYVLNHLNYFKIQRYEITFDTLRQLKSEDEGKHIIIKTNGWERGTFEIKAISNSFCIANRCSDFITVHGTYTGEWYLSFQNISGLDDFEGEFISVVADGGYIGQKLVQNGTIDLGRFASVVWIGYAYDCYAYTFNLGTDAQTQVANKNVCTFTMRFVDSAGGCIGTDKQDLHPIHDFKTTDLYDLPPALMNEDIRIVCLDKSSKTKRIYLEQPIPAPFCLTMLQCEATYRSMP